MKNYLVTPRNHIYHFTVSAHSLADAYWEVIRILKMTGCETLEFDLESA
jgi:hypothetical protein